MYEGINGYLFHFNYMHLFTTFFQHSIYGGEGEEGFSPSPFAPKSHAREDALEVVGCAILYCSGSGSGT
jgi:hypothetical protein